MAGYLETTDNQNESILNPSKLPPYFYISNRDYFDNGMDLNFNLTAREFTLRELSRLANLHSVPGSNHETPTPTPSGRIPYPSYRPEYNLTPSFQPLPYTPRVYLPSSTIRPKTDSGTLRENRFSQSSSFPLYNTTPRNRYGNRVYHNNPINNQLPVTRGTSVQPWLHPHLSDQFFTVKSRSLSVGSIPIPSPILIIIVFITCTVSFGI